MNKGIRIQNQQYVAFLILGLLSEREYSESYLPLSEISIDHGVSVLFLKKIVRSLRNAGLVESREGVSGGYRLAIPPNRITLWQVIQTVSGKSNIFPNELKGREACPINSACLPERIHRTIDSILEKAYSNVTMSDLIAQ